MEAAWNTKKRAANTAVQKSLLVEHDNKEVKTLTGDEILSINQENCRTKEKINVYSNKSFESWKFGTINIRSGKEKDDGSKIYCIAKQLAKLNLTFCCLQEVKYHGSGSKLIVLDSGEEYQYYWCGMKKKREAGVVYLLRIQKIFILTDQLIKIRV